MKISELWNFQITILLKAYSLPEIVTGNKKYETLSKEEDNKRWLKNDAKAKKLLVSTVD